MTDEELNEIASRLRRTANDSLGGESLQKALLVGVFDKTTTDLDCCISSSSRDTGKIRQPVAVVMCKDGRLQEVNVRRVVIDGSDEVFDMYAWMFNEDDITEQL